MMRPQPEFRWWFPRRRWFRWFRGVNMLAFLMKRRKTVSVTPAMGANGGGRNADAADVQS